MLGHIKGYGYRDKGYGIRGYAWTYKGLMLGHIISELFSTLAAEDVKDLSSVWKQFRVPILNENCVYCCNASTQLTILYK